MKNLAEITTHTVQTPSGRRRQVFEGIPVTPFQVDPNWYQRYWLEEHPRRAPRLQALIGIAAKRILRLFRQSVTAYRSSTFDSPIGVLKLVAGSSGLAAVVWEKSSARQKKTYHRSGGPV
jgi:hypothetical protein